MGSLDESLVAPDFFPIRPGKQLFVAPVRPHLPRLPLIFELRVQNGTQDLSQSRIFYWREELDPILSRFRFIASAEPM